jgi:hypothetical protein
LLSFCTRAQLCRAALPAAGQPIRPALIFINFPQIFCKMFSSARFWVQSLHITSYQKTMWHLGGWIHDRTGSLSFLSLLPRRRRELSRFASSDIWQRNRTYAIDPGYIILIY